MPWDLLNWAKPITERRGHKGNFMIESELVDNPRKAQALSLQAAEKKPEAVIVAAGFSKRAGGFKPLFNLEGKSVLERCLEVFLPYCSGIYVVVGYRGEEIKKAFSGCKHVNFVDNPQYELGMFSSIKAGCRQVSSSRFFVCPGDLPFIPKTLPPHMLQDEAEVLIPSFKGRAGHPILLDSALIPAIMRESDSSNLRTLLTSYKKKYLEVSEDTILMDIDTPEAYETALRRLENLRKY